MIRTNTTFTLLQAITAVVTLAIILWFVGVPFFRTAEAANVISFSNTLSDSEPQIVSNHTLSFVLPTGLPEGESISLDFATTGFSGIGSLNAQDLDLNINGVEQSLVDTPPDGPDWNVNPAGTTIDITSGTTTISANATVTIEIGTNASTGGAGVNQITNPIVGSYQITLTAGTSTGATIVAIVDVVTVTAAVETVFNFTVLGVAGGQGINEDTTASSTTSTEIPFGVLVANTPKVAAQDLQVETNAANGFVVTVQTDQQLTSATGADIDGFANGTYLSSPLLWEAPTVALGTEDTYGHWGITTDDDTVTSLLTDEFGVAAVEAYSRYVSASTTPVEVFRNDGPANETVQGVGTTRVGYSVEITGLQEAGDDYTATLTYVATPVF
jgi:hypothetical protein